jgi:hypothetical protein
MGWEAKCTWQHKQMGDRSTRATGGRAWPSRGGSRATQTSSSRNSKATSVLHVSSLGKKIDQCLPVLLASRSLLGSPSTRVSTCVYTRALGPTCHTLARAARQYQELLALPVAVAVAAHCPGREYRVVPGGANSSLAGLSCRSQSRVRLVTSPPLPQQTSRPRMRG